MSLTAADAAAVLLARRRARASFEHYAEYIAIPGRVVNDDDDRCLPVETSLAEHHRLICRAVQRTIERPHGRLLILAGPGSAKSSYTTVCAPTWVMGKRPGTRIILASHNSTLAAKQSRRARSIVKSARFKGIFDTVLPDDQRAADEWALTNGSQCMSGGILSGITGNRADGVIADDLIAGREEAESETTRAKVWEAWYDDLRTRLVSGGWAIHIMTRWHPKDPAGMILPEGWDGESGMFEGSDGLQWEVLSLRSKIETPEQAANDPLGRQPGEYLWPEYFDRQHWVQVDPALGAAATNTVSGRRAWYSMHQQTPKPDAGVLFSREDFIWFNLGDEPKNLRYYGASDYAVTDEELTDTDPDYTEHGIVGIDHEKNWWILDWFYNRRETDKSIAAFIELIRRWKPETWFGERGVIESAISPAIRDAMEMSKPKVYVTRELLPTVGQGNKIAKVRTFQYLVEQKRVRLPRTPWAYRLVEQLCAFPAVAHDDAVDVVSVLARGLDQQWSANKPSRPKITTPNTPFTHADIQRQIAQKQSGDAEKRKYFE